MKPSVTMEVAHLMISNFCVWFRTAVCLAAALAIAAIGAAPGFAQTVGATLAADCGDEIKRHCAAVTPGESRVVACLIAYEDRITPRCRLTAYLASGELGNRLSILQKMARLCSSDITQYCSKVVPGGGRIYDCIKKNKATLTDECRKGLETLSPL